MVANDTDRTGPSDAELVGMALSGERLIVPVADPERERPGYTPRPGLYALDLSSGELLWQYAVQRALPVGFSSGDSDRAWTTSHDLGLRISVRV